MIKRYFRKLMYREVVLEESGCTYYFLKNRITSDAVLHRTDGPARIYADGSQEWYLNGRLHRSTGPARILSNGDQEWWLNGKRHRADGPARILSNGCEFWYLNGTMYSYEGYINELFPEDSPQRTLFVLKWS